jgi:predicted transcriptional regulator
MQGQDILIVNAVEDIGILKGLASEVRIRILQLLRDESLNVNELSSALKLPQSTVATNVQILEKAGLIRTENIAARKGMQKRCRAVYQEVVLQIPATKQEERDEIEVEMPIGLYTNFEVSPPCGLCSTEGIIGYLDVPDDFLNPGRSKAGLLWFEKGYVEYKFPNNSIYKKKPVTRIEVSAELSSETPGTNPNLLSDITLWINGAEVGVWTSPGDFGDKRGKLTPQWWKLEGSQYGFMKQWSVTDSGSFVDGVRVSDVKLADLCLADHHSIRVRLGVKDDAAHLGGMNIFGRGFGNYDKDIVLRLDFSPQA